MAIEFIKEGLRIFLTRFKPYPKYKGNAREICHTIVSRCWNNRYFQTGACTYPQFWTRDFGFCTQALLNLGYKKEAQQTLEYALTQFKKQNKIGTHITQNGKVLDFPTYAVDSLPLLLHSIRLARLNIKEYKTFLNEQIVRFYETAFDAKRGIIKPKTYFSSMKDYFVKNSSCYDNCMVALLSEETDLLKLNNPFKGIDFKRNIQQHFWNGFYFNEDLTNAEVTGDANTFPFWCGIFDDIFMFESCLKYVQVEELDQPWPLKYTKKNHFGQIKESVFVPYWEGDKIWLHLGLCFIEAAANFDKSQARKYLQRYKEMIETNKNCLEVFNPNGTHYSSLFYKADHSMLWACKYLELDSYLNRK